VLRGSIDQNWNILMADVFISYERSDRRRVQPIVAGLQAEGWTVFWDRKIPAGQTWRQHLRRALDDACCILVAWSKTSVQSEWVIEEADEGKRRRILVPLCLDPVDPPLGFRTVQAAELTEWSRDTEAPAWRDLVASVRHFLGGTSPLTEAAQRRMSKHARTRLTQWERFKTKVYWPIWASCLCVLLAAGIYVFKSTIHDLPVIKGVVTSASNNYALLCREAVRLQAMKGGKRLAGRAHRFAINIEDINANMAKFATDYSNQISALSGYWHTSVQRILAERIDDIDRARFQRLTARDYEGFIAHRQSPTKKTMLRACRS
jgi:hypothetical protein